MINGIHHITAIASDAKQTVYFYSVVLGLKLVKKTVNQDDVRTYHLFFGDNTGNPGMDLTFFIFLPAFLGKLGNGLVTTISFAVPEDSLSFWIERFEQFNVKHGEIIERFGKKRLWFTDRDNQQLELVGVAQKDVADSEFWSTSPVPQKYAIGYFFSATLSVVKKSTIEPILIDVFGYEWLQTEDHVHLYSLKNSKRAGFLEISELQYQQEGINAAGTVHHIAFRAKDTKEQNELRNKVVRAGLYPTEVIDRFYFKSVYFRTPGGILFEIATDGPGFTADEQVEYLGKKLALPPFLESKRSFIEAQLPDISLD